MSALPGSKVGSWEGPKSRDAWNVLGSWREMAWTRGTPSRKEGGGWVVLGRNLLASLGLDFIPVQGKPLGTHLGTLLSKIPLSGQSGHIRGA